MGCITNQHQIDFSGGPGHNLSLSHSVLTPIFQVDASGEAGTILDFIGAKGDGGSEW